MARTNAPDSDYQTERQLERSKVRYWARRECALLGLSDGEDVGELLEELLGKALGAADGDWLGHSVHISDRYLWN
jgi:hypothetical protein